jgi:4-azaleucine resistance transporter AzlC
MQEFIRGCGRVMGVVAGFLPIAMSFGALSVQSGLSVAATVGMSMGLYAGASQFAAIEGVRQHLPWLSIVLTILIINLRHIPMSLAASRQYCRFGRDQRWLLSHGLIDETFALEMSDQPQSFLYYLGMHVGCWTAWVIGTWLGCQVGLLLPERWFQFALPGLFLYLLVDNVRRRWQREMAIVLAVGVALVLATRSLGSTGMLLAILGVTAIACLFPRLNQSLSQSVSEES